MISVAIKMRADRRLLFGGYEYVDADPTTGTRAGPHGRPIWLGYDLVKGVWVSKDVARVFRQPKCWATADLAEEVRIELAASHPNLAHNIVLVNSTTIIEVERAALTAGDD